ncbi:ABC transporter substrate-binding protein [Schaalia sp. Marseille-Q2122]|uniref:ABC transporter substrate-binding protein n=1 Tax=Schaalia sp. Marseille-Q2122 TaxID=2736604 RepID=UPI001588AF84|nr:ABC transporter substrate-binding protein [Schaalia sp. Marseille-Q2122]
MRIRPLALLCAGALALSACASTPTDAPASASSHEATQSAQATPAAEAHDHQLDQVRAIVPQTMAFGAPMATFGDHGNLDSVAKAHSVSNWDGVEQLKSHLMNGEAELAATPAYVAANLYNKGIDVRLVGPVVWGMLFVLAPEGTTEGDWEAMRGKKVAIPLPGNMPDLVFSYLLSKNNLTKDDIEPVYAEDGQQAIGLLMKGEVDWVVLPEHAATIAQAKAAENGKNLTRALDLQQEWAKVTGKEARFPMAGLVMPGALVDEHPELVDAVIAEVKAGVEKANAGDKATLEKIAQHYDLPVPVVEKVIPRLQLNMVPASEAREAYEDFLTRLGEVNPDIYGGKLPDDRFYAG